MFHFDIVHGCQLRCVGCPNSTLLPKVKRTPLDKFERCMLNVDVDYVHILRLFNYGEPLLHPDISGIFEILQRQRWRADQVEITTNAQHVYWEDFQNALKMGVLTRLVVSCDGDATPEEYERLRPPSKWGKLIEFLQRAREIRDSHAPDMELIARSIVKTSEDTRAWRELLEPLGWESEFRGWKAFPDAKENMTGRDIEVGEGICTFVAPSDQFNHNYHGELNQLYVDYDGKVVPCCVHPNAGTLGDLSQHTFSEILYSKQRADFLRQMETNRRSMPVCGRCEYGPPARPGPSFADNAPELIPLLNNS